MELHILLMILLLGTSYIESYVWIMSSYLSLLES